MRVVVAILLALTIGLLAGAWYGSQPKTCAWVDTNYGRVLMCSNDYREHVTQ